MQHAHRLRPRFDPRAGHTRAQITAFEQAGFERIVQEKASGGRWDRPELHRLLDQLRADDVVVVWKLDRLSRSLKDLLLTLERIENVGADFQSLTESVDTSTPAGRMMMQIVGSFGEFERAMLRERTQNGLNQGRSAGRDGPNSRSSNNKRSSAWSDRGKRPGGGCSIISCSSVYGG